jgi:hypothetical protein
MGMHPSASHILFTKTFQLNLGDAFSRICQWFLKFKKTLWIVFVQSGVRKQVIVKTGFVGTDVVVGDYSTSS